jgi:intein/homing endonuclease
MVPIPNYLDKLDGGVRVCGVYPILQESHAKTQLTNKEVGKKMGVSTAYYYDQLTTKKVVSIRFLKMFKKHVDSEIFDKIYDQKDILFTAKKRKVNLPREIGPELAYFYGYLQGDGCLTSDKRGMTFTDEYPEQIQKINELSMKLFGFNGLIYSRMSANALKPYYHLEIKSVVVSSFLHHILGINRGIKSNLHIPTIIAKNEELCKYYLAGLFDADGTLPKNPEKAKQLFIDITMKDRGFIRQPVRAAVLGLIPRPLGR